jgi:hypothetical protein
MPRCFGAGGRRGLQKSGRGTRGTFVSGTERGICIGGKGGKGISRVVEAAWSGISRSRKRA